MAQTDLAVRIATILDASGLKKADKGIAKLQKSVRGLNLGFALSAAGATAFAKASVNAFIADEAAASKLSNTVKNLGMEFASPYITQYISDLEKTAKVADDQLRPAFQILIQQTGSLAASQSALSTAIEVSRGSGVSLSTVANDLAQAYVGNTKGLRKYYLGLSTAALSAKSFTEIQKIMNDQFSGSSAAYLSTYSGQVGVLSLAWGNFQESVGGALLTMASFGSGGQSQGLSNLATVLDKIGGAVTLIAKGFNSVSKLFNLTGKGGLLSGFNPTGIPRGGSMADGGKIPNPQDKYAAQLAKIEADRKKQNQAILNAHKKLTAEQKKQAALKKAGTIFDLQYIGLIASLKGKLSEEEKTRVLAQLALLAGNEAEAKKLTDQIIAAQDGGKDLAKFLATLPNANNPFAYLEKYLEELKKKAMELLYLQPIPQAPNLPETEYNLGTYPNYGSIVPPETNVPPQTDQGFMMNPDLPGSAGSDSQFGSNTPWAQASSITIAIDGKAIANAMLDQSLSAGNVSTINRLAGGF